MAMKIDIIICGVGGQGVLVASEIIGNLALMKGLDAKKSEIHGMAQRGGSVFSHVRIAQKVHSPVIPLGCADYMLAFEELEALRYAKYLKPGAVVLVNTQRISPMTVLSGEATYPDDPVSMLSKHFKVYPINAVELAKKAGNIRTLNTVMLGALARHLPWAKEEWIRAIEFTLPEKLHRINAESFMLGVENALL